MFCLCCWQLLNFSKLLTRTKLLGILYCQNNSETCSSQLCSLSRSGRSSYRLAKSPVPEILEEEEHPKRYKWQLVRHNAMRGAGARPPASASIDWWAGAGQGWLARTTVHLPPSALSAVTKTTAKQFRSPGREKQWMLNNPIFYYFSLRINSNILRLREVTYRNMVC